MSETFFEWIRAGIPLVLGLVVSYLVMRFGDPLKRLKDLSTSPVVSILASTAVLLAEALWGDYGGEVQFEAACEWLAARLGVPVDQVRELVQAAYDALKAILGDEWGTLKPDLAPE